MPRNRNLPPGHTSRPINVSFNLYQSHYDLMHAAAKEDGRSNADYCRRIVFQRLGLPMAEADLYQIHSSESELLGKALQRVAEETGASPLELLRHLSPEVLARGTKQAAEDLRARNTLAEKQSKRRGGSGKSGAHRLEGTPPSSTTTGSRKRGGN